MTTTGKDGAGRGRGPRLGEEAGASGPPAGHGRGSAIAHHGEILQGMFVGPGDGPMRGLVTLPCELYSSDGEFRPRDEPGVVVAPDWKWKAQKAAQLTLDYLGADGVGGRLRVDTTIPIGWGMGSSTSDVIAAIRATADGIGVALHTEEVARLAVAAETASDSIMFGDRALLFAQRDALVIEDFGAHFPPFEVLGFAAGNAVDTLGFTPAHYDDRDIERFEELRTLLREGFQSSCTERVGHVATASARINQRFLPKAEFDRLLATVDVVGAVGLQVAHSGSVVGVLFDGDHADEHDEEERERGDEPEQVERHHPRQLEEVLADRRTEVPQRVEHRRRPRGRCLARRARRPAGRRRSGSFVLRPSSFVLRPGPGRLASPTGTLA
jgi:uncharacterized protein involved in propanediol utilization